MSLEDIQKRLKDPSIKPGSQEERDLLEEARGLREADTNEYFTVKKGELESANEQGVPRLTPEDAQHMGQIAIHKVETSQQQIPVSTPDHKVEAA